MVKVLRITAIAGLVFIVERDVAGGHVKASEARGGPTKWRSRQHQSRETEPYQRRIHICGGEGEAAIV